MKLTVAAILGKCEGATLRLGANQKPAFTHAYLLCLFPVLLDGHRYPGMIEAIRNLALNREGPRYSYHPWSSYAKTLTKLSFLKSDILQ